MLGLLHISWRFVARKGWKVVAWWFVWAIYDQYESCKPRCNSIYGLLFSHVFTSILLQFQSRCCILGDSISIGSVADVLLRPVGKPVWPWRGAGVWALFRISNYDIQRPWHLQILIDFVGGPFVIWCYLQGGWMQDDAEILRMYSRSSCASWGRAVRSSRCERRRKGETIRPKKGDRGPGHFLGQSVVQNHLEQAVITSSGARR